MEKSIVSIKGFDGNLACRGYQFEIGKTYEHAGTVKACNRGFHACTTDAHPFEVFKYYAPAGSRFCLVTQSGGTHSDDCLKIASGKITIDVEISIGDLVKRAWDYVWSRAIKSDESHVTGDYGAASSTGYQGAASSTGRQGAASITGDYGAASSTGDYGAASSTGDCGAGPARVIKARRPARVIKARRPARAVKARRPARAVKARRPARVIKARRPARVIKARRPARVIKARRPARAVKARRPARAIMARRPARAIMARLWLADMPEKSWGPMAMHCLQLSAMRKTIALSRLRRALWDAMALMLMFGMPLRAVNWLRPTNAQTA